MSVLVRIMQKDDRPAWAEMRQQLFDDLSIEAHCEEIDDVLESKNCWGYIAVTEDQAPAGFAEISIRKFANGCTTQPVPFLEGIWVSSNYRRMGVGRTLVEHITQDLFDQGFVELCSDADEQNFNSHRAHEDWGFVETERVIYFRKALT
ncbi:MAG: GNAT family N-acetyltransferase [Rhizobiaceae bacterium]|nr:GNAT family N-acetyltransferase [Rhizobiaceae bacterium]